MADSRTNRFYRTAKDANETDRLREALRIALDAMRRSADDHNCDYCRADIAAVERAMERPKPDEHCGYTPETCPYGDACADCGKVAFDDQRTPDSPRWCDHCKTWGDHHTDRCPHRLASDEDDR